MRMRIREISDPIEIIFGDILDGRAISRHE